MGSILSSLAGIFVIVSIALSQTAITQHQNLICCPITDLGPATRQAYDLNEFGATSLELATSRCKSDH